ncbi:hypothetical protein [Falsirhodobacter sp. 20TX0035]|uniref:hypothetical protein n=1 Tax=Falsirhodobacter sp. 20TX0035 TaxID=3022019 RepID=UPI00232FAB5D|nr:hypothetical protein [Falsirhodobacter sp. 20TX0035]MDB6452431.1 hypothetical protein [Falsirhodobacter sp. 20TX0035]
MADNDRQGHGAGRPGAEGPLIEIAGAAGIVLWLGAVIGWWVSQPEGQGPGLFMALLLIGGPLALMVGLISTLRALRDLRAETARLHGALDAARTEPQGMTRPAVARTEPPRAMPVDVPAAEPVWEEEPVPSELTLDDYLRALNFPDSPDDVEGIAALQAVLNDPEAARLIRSAQDVLTLLAEDGVFVDDLVPEAPRPDLWRRFAGGERSPATTAIAAIRDRAALGTVAARLREDQIFQDAAHHFLRSFDRSLPAFGEYATDGELAALAETRTARAFMLVARAAGSFE